MEKKKIIICEIIGFGFVIIFIWLDEIIDLPHVLFKTPQTPINFTESILESFIVIVLAILVIVITKKLLIRIKYLEGFLHICCVCKKIYDCNSQEWVHFETYFDTHSKIEFSQGFCTECKKIYDKIL